MKFLAINMKGISTVLSFKVTVLPAFLYSLVGVSLYGHSGVFTGRRQYPWLETPVSLRGNCSFPPGNGSSDVGNEDFNCRKINFDAWCDIFFLRFSYTVLQINGICNVFCNSICTAILMYLSGCYYGFVADGRCFLFFKLYCRDFHLSLSDCCKSAITTWSNPISVIYQSGALRRLKLSFTPLKAPL